MSRLSVIDAATKRWCDWEANPPKNSWDLERRSILAFIEMSENFLAQLKSRMAEYPADHAPNFASTLALMDIGREAARHAGDIDGQLTLQLDRASALELEQVRTPAK